MSEQGFIVLWRQIRKNWLYEEKRTFSRYEAWIDLIMDANHDDHKFLLGGEVIDVKEGQVITSELKLMKRWSWSKTKLRRFLETLKNESMIEILTDKKKTTITLCNYSTYQKPKTIEKPQKNHKKTTERPQKDTINNYNNYNNENNDNSICSPQNPKFQKPTIEMVIEYAQASVRDLFEIDCRAFYDYYTANGWRVGKNSMKDWKAALRNWARNKRQFGSKSSTTPPVQRGSGNVCPL